MSKSQNPARMLRVFLCHSSGDKKAVRDLYNRLRADGIDPWLDEENILPGQKWQQEIPNAVRASDIVIICLSKGAINKTGYVQKEIKYALDIADEQPEGTIFLIPIKLEECDIPDRLKEWQWVKMFETGGYERLMRALRFRADALEITLRSSDKAFQGYTDGTLIAGYSPVVISFKNILEPDIEHLVQTLEPYKNWQPENLRYMVPVQLKLHADVIERLGELEQLVDNDAWPKGVGEEAKDQLRKFVKEEIENRFIPAITNGVRIVFATAKQSAYHSYTLAPSEVKTLLYYYISARIMVLVRWLLAFRLVNTRDPYWMSQFYNVSIDWGSTIRSGLPYICKLCEDETLFWVDADIYRSIGMNSQLIRVFIPSNILLQDQPSKLARESFLKYLAPQVVEHCLEKLQTDSLTDMANFLERFELSVRKEWIIETESFATIPTSGIGSHKLLQLAERVEEFFSQRIKRGEIEERTARRLSLSRLDFLPKLPTSKY